VIVHAQTLYARPHFDDPARPFVAEHSGVNATRIYALYSGEVCVADTRRNHLDQHFSKGGSFHIDGIDE
jgi:hypothetical protein